MDGDGDGDGLWVRVAKTDDGGEGGAWAGLAWLGLAWHGAALGPAWMLRSVCVFTCQALASSGDAMGKMRNLFLSESVSILWMLSKENWATSFCCIP